MPSKSASETLNRLQKWFAIQTYRLPGGADRARAVVKNGYDEIAGAYAAWARAAENNRKRNRWVAALADSLPPGTALLDLGCGPGHELARWSRRGLKVTGVDLSPASLALAHENAPDATCFCADMTKQTFAPQSFEVIVAFYSIIHLPRRQQIRLVKRARTWLKSGGLFLANMAARPFTAMHEGNWLGVPMYWSSLGVRRTRRLFDQEGFSLLRSELATETALGRTNTFFWFVAQKGAASAASCDRTTSLLQALARHDPPTDPTAIAHD